MLKLVNILFLMVFAVLIGMCLKDAYYNTPIKNPWVCNLVFAYFLAYFATDSVKFLMKGNKNEKRNNP